MLNHACITYFKLPSTGFQPPNSPHSHQNTEFQNGTSVPTPNLISLKPASLENAKISTSLFLSHSALMSLETALQLLRDRQRENILVAFPVEKRGRVAVLNG